MDCFSLASPSSVSQVTTAVSSSNGDMKMGEYAANFFSFATFELNERCNLN